MSVKKNPVIVKATDWNVVGKLKNAGDFEILYNPHDTFNSTYLGALQSIWIEEYANDIKNYNDNSMTKILFQTLESLTNDRTFKTILCHDVFDSNEIPMITRLANEIILLPVKEESWMGLEDKYLIEYQGYYYTMSQYREAVFEKDYPFIEREK